MNRVSTLTKEDVYCLWYLSDQRVDRREISTKGQCVTMSAGDLHARRRVRHEHHISGG
jgi:hypothetical protein